MSRFTYSWLGQIPYQQASAWQERLALRRAQFEIPDYMLALEHPPTYTAGTRTLPQHQPQPTVLAAVGASFFVTNRGGSITYHGPGQLVGYPIVHLSVVNNDVHRYLRILEEACILTLAEWGIQAQRDPAYTGVWVGESKIASIGVRVTHRVAMHGFALNIAPNLTAFEQITPCGIVGRGVTSVAALGVKPPSLADAAACTARHLSDLLGHSTCDYVSADSITLG